MINFFSKSRILSEYRTFRPICLKKHNVDPKVAETAAAALRSVNVTEAEFKAAKKALSLEIGESAINPVSLACEIGVSGLLRSGHPLTDADKLDLVAQATLADVQVCFYEGF
jgi:hypothetical protein